MTEILERKAAITGIGQSDVGRRLNRDPLALTVDACLAAIADAGLTRADIDGVSTYPGMMSAAWRFRRIRSVIRKMWRVCRVRCSWLPNEHWDRV